MKETIGILLMIIIFLIVLLFTKGKSNLSEYKIRSLESTTKVEYDYLGTSSKIYYPNSSYIKINTLNSRYKVGDTILLDKYYVIIEKF